MRRQTCQAFPGGAVPSGAAEEHAVPAAPLSAAEAEEQPPLGSAIQRQQAPPLWRAACASGPGLRSLPYVPKQSPKPSSSIRSGRLPARPRENLVRARGGLFHHQVERLFRSVWSCTIILSPSALFCRLSALWELMPLVIRSGLLPSAQSEPLAAPAGAKRHSQSRSAPPPTPAAPRDRVVTFRTKSSPGPGKPKVLWSDQLRCRYSQPGHFPERPTPSRPSAAHPAPCGCRSRSSVARWRTPAFRRDRSPSPAVRTRQRTLTAAPSSVPCSWHHLILRSWSIG